jgi:hypothetical protein
MVNLAIVLTDIASPIARSLGESDAQKGPMDIFAELCPPHLAQSNTPKIPPFDGTDNCAREYLRHRGGGLSASPFLFVKILTEGTST